MGPQEAAAGALDTSRASGLAAFWRNVLLGAAALVPLLIVWLLAERALSLFPALPERFEPVTRALAERPFVAGLLLLVGTVLVLACTGWLATTVVGRRIERLPLVRSIYGTQRRLLEVLQADSAGQYPVVLVRDPDNALFQVAIVTSFVRDRDTKEDLLAIYLPGSPNAASGRVRVLPADDVVATDWTPGEALRFAASGGAAAPDMIRRRPGLRTATK